MDRKEKVLKFFEEEANFPLMLSECETILGVPEGDREEFYRIIDELLKEGKLIKSGKKRLKATKRADTFVGDFISNERGFGFVFCENFDRDFYVSAENINGAIDKDRVLIKSLKPSVNGARQEARVVKILERKEREITGVFKKRGPFSYLKSSNKKNPDEIYIYENNVGAKDGDRVIAVINPLNYAKCECKVKEVLGRDGDIGIDVREILINYQIKEEFPKNVLLAAKRQPKEVCEDEFLKRVDLTNEVIVTIDGADAKDLDDAINVKKLENGNYELGVHIADVGSYVKRGGVIDKEAFRRGTSVYPVDRVVPMLPVELSNGICSLNEGVLRLALSVIMEINADGAVVARKIFESVIKTKAKMTYSDVNEILAGKEEICEKYDELVFHFKNMYELSEILRKKRVRRGSIDFDFPEAKVVLDKNGECVDIIKCERGISNGIIEEFMLVCNETVAAFMSEMNLPSVYRIHEAPGEEKLAVLSDFVKSFGYFMPRNIKNVSPSAFQKILKECKGKPEERAISHVMLRSMMKAGYSEENLGHFALALKNYCHFTSPIRRYPDLVVHRILKDYLHKKRINKPELKSFVSEAAGQSSIAEIRAQEAERDALDLKKAEYMQNYVGENFSGTVSSVTSFGMFVELDNTVEGLVGMSELFDDYYEFDEENMRLVGTRHNKIYAVGDSVNITVKRCDKKAREIDFSLAENKGNKGISTKSGHEKRSKIKKGEKKKQRNKIITKRFLKKKRKKH